MVKMKSLVVLFILVASQSLTVKAYPSGAPTGQCKEMTPSHDGNLPQTGAAPYTLTVSKQNYTAGETLSVTLSGSTTFKGFLLMARQFGGNEDAYGALNVLGGTQSLACPGPGNAVTHTDNSAKSSLTFTWTAPNPAVGHVFFIYTVVQAKPTFWVQEMSAPVIDPTAPPLTTPAPLPSQGPISSINTAQCGSSKGCYREPKDCTEANCQYLVTWKQNNNYIDFEMTGLSDGWMAIGFSPDNKMGDDAVTQCAYASKDNRVYVQLSYNAKGIKSNGLVSSTPNGTLTNTEAYYSNGRVSCKFSQIKKPSANQGQIFDLSQEYYLLLARGKASQLGAKQRHSLEPKKDPLVSPVKVNLNNFDNISGRYKYPLVKAHGILMLIGWMFSASLGIILARFYKPMWPNSKWCGVKIWFAVHRACMVTALVCTIVGFILIFIFVGGYSNLPGWPYTHIAHPILGIIVTTLCILNPIMAIFRCGPTDAKRPIFNWAHWAVGTLAHCLAIPTIFIGLSLAKASVIWWATWVMVAFVLFHVIVEIILEIHNCYNARKNKDKTEQFEMQKKGSNPPLTDVEPEPVGRRFKNIMLCIYVTVAAICGIILVIVVAVG